MEFKLASQTDISSIMNIIQGAQEYLRENGVDQWQNNYPNTDTIQNDIRNNNSYILLKDTIMVGTVAVMFDGEKTYDSIYNGKWISEGEYAVIHRMAISPNYHGLGLAAEIIKYVEDMCKSRGITSIKVDTHQDNIVMQHLLLKNRFKYCGTIYLEDGNKRTAFEKIITL